MAARFEARTSRRRSGLRFVRENVICLLGVGVEGEGNSDDRDDLDPAA